MGDDGAAYAREWLDKAYGDLRTAEILLVTAQPMTAIVGFHCQQALEKLLKAFLTYHQQIFEKSRQLGRLCRQCSDIDGAFQPLAERVDRLTKFAVRQRYPGDPDPTLDEAHEALKMVREVWHFVLARLPESVQDFKLEP